MRYKKVVFGAILFLAGVGMILTGFPKGLPAEVSFSQKQEPEIEEWNGRAEEITLISVYDNYQVNPKLKTAWGFGCVVKTSSEFLLFDTGGNSGILLFNLGKMNIDPKRIRTVMISHIHEDHVGGLKGFLEKNSNAAVFIPNSFPNSVRDMITNQKARFVNVSQPGKISGFSFSTGELYGPPKEQSLIIKSKKGLVIITGCAHPGVVNIVGKAKEIFPEEEVYLVVGGFHHPPMAVIKKFRELGVKKVAPSHCTGDQVREAFRNEYREDFIEYGVGKIVEIK
jgi:7,8-dihydropterin-6-yl-methyl-4-(beta-D-ribofuranosyl)aminobenzene 5'-phosphate synthase